MIAAAVERTYRVPGMTCEHCLMSVTEEVARIDGVRDASAALATGRLTVVGDGFTDAAVKAAVAEAGYEVVA